MGGGCWAVGAWWWVIDGGWWVACGAWWVVGVGWWVVGNWGGLGTLWLGEWDNGGLGDWDTWELAQVKSNSE